MKNKKRRLNLHGMKSYSATPHKVSYNVYKISVWYAHSRVRNNIRNFPTEVSRSWHYRCITIAPVTYPYFQFFQESDAQPKHKLVSNATRPTKSVVSTLTTFRHHRPLDTMDRLNRSAVNEEKSVNCEA